jgi:hypothetical protein
LNTPMSLSRHCEQSEAIHVWIATSLRSSR